MIQQQLMTLVGLARQRVTLLPLALSALGLGCVEAQPETSPEFDRVVLVTIDTLRADHLQTYGYARQTSPFIDRLAENGVVFERAISTMSHTAPSHASMFTGLLPLGHRVLKNGDLLSKDIHTFVQSFGAAGYKTGAFVSNGFLGRSTNDFQVLNGWLRKGEETVDQAIAWIESLEPAQPFFMWVHFFDVHEAELEGMAAPQKYYEANASRTALPPDQFYSHLAKRHGLADPMPEEEFAPIRWEPRLKIRSNWLESRAEVIDRVDDYDALIAYVDDQIERLYVAVESFAPLSPSLWVIASDHGEALGDHGYRGHGAYIYQEQLHVPLIIHSSDESIDAGRFESQVSLVDLHPTLLDVLGSGASSSDGFSLWPALRASSSSRQNRAVFAQKKQMVSLKNCVFTMIDGDFKYIYHSVREDELYDLASDPGELVNLIDSPAAEAYRTRLLAKLEEYPWEDLMNGSIKTEELPDEIHDELEALGYMGDE
ncbi:MAG: arylsulfatase A-like enzyme [Planctomycetota bacterium]|jgi:arylsulfatase A-like enzyme